MLALLASAVAGPATFSPPPGARAEDWVAAVHAAGLALASPGATADVELRYDGAWVLEVDGRRVPVPGPDSPAARADVALLAASLTHDVATRELEWTIPPAPKPHPRAPVRIVAPEPIPEAPFPPVAAVLLPPDPFAVDPSELVLDPVPVVLTPPRPPPPRIAVWGRALGFVAWEPGATTFAGGGDVMAGGEVGRVRGGVDVGYRRAAIADAARFDALDVGLLGEWVPGPVRVGLVVSASSRAYTLPDGYGSNGVMACLGAYAGVRIPLGATVDLVPLARVQADLGTVSLRSDGVGWAPSPVRGELALAVDLHAPEKK